MVRAAVLKATGDTSVEVRDDLEVLGPGPGEVRVRIVATGVCHSDLSAMSGVLPQPAPAVLGHEGAGEVVAVGEGVTSVAPGDHVIVVWMPPCGQCRWCLGGQPNLCLTITAASATNPRFRLGDQPVFGMSGTGTWAEELVLPQQAVVRIDPDIPLEVAALVGCGVTTGVGAVLNAGRPRPGDSAVVFGCGGVGISAIQGARIAACHPIVAVDPRQDKHELARRFGATHATTPEGLAELSAQLTGGDGFDLAVECVGRPDTIRAAYDATRRGGTTVVVGIGSVSEPVPLNAFEVAFMERRIVGSLYGSADVRRDFPRMLRLWRAGVLDLEGMITRRIDLSQVNDALEALRRGEGIRQVITL